MKIIKNFVYTIFMNEESIKEINKIKIQVFPIIFVFTNILFPFLFNCIFLLVKHKFDFDNIGFALYLILWNVIMNFVLVISLSALLFIKCNMKSFIAVKTVISMNFINPITALLGLFINNIIFSLAIILYDILFSIKYVSVTINSDDNKNKKLYIYVLLSFLLVFIFLCLTKNVYLLF